MRSITWNRFPTKKLPIEAMLISCVETVADPDQAFGGGS